MLNKRLTVNQLCKNYSEKVSNAKKVYLEHLTDAEEYLCKNLQMAIKMDKRFGTEEPKGPDGSDDSTESSKGNNKATNILQCSFLTCQTKTVKLKRHLLLKHQKQPEDVINYALHAAKILQENKRCTTTSSSGDLNDEFKSANIERHARYSRTKLVSSRHNRKKCIVCGRLCINMGDHVHSVYKIEVIISINTW